MNLESVKEYQAKNLELHKTANLESVKKYQAKDPEISKAMNLESVKEYQAKNLEVHNAANLESVKKYQAKNPEISKTMNLESVKEYQAKNLEVYNAAHLESVKKYQAKNPEISKAMNLDSVKEYQAKNLEMHKVSNLKSVKKYQTINSENFKLSNLESVKKYQKKIESNFPPRPLSLDLQHKIALNFCKDTAPKKFEEAGCAVCGKLTLFTELQKLSELKLDLNVLIQQGVTQAERKSSNDDLKDINGPILENDLDNICNLCHKSILKGKMPSFALANGKWIGKVPDELQNLSYAEQLLIARVRHNRCLVRVSSGMRKMRANVISFANPTPKIYNILPPPLEEMDNVLAFIYTGPCKPTKSDFESNSTFSLS